jgi:hypothetical protein
MIHSTGLPTSKKRLPGSRFKPIPTWVYVPTVVRFAVAALAFCILWLTQSANALEAGFAKADITPVLGTPLAGRLERWGRGSETIHDPLSARCVYLEDDEANIFLVSVDLYAVSPELRSRVLELAPQVTSPEHIVLAATHTHSGSGGMDAGIVRRVTNGRSSPRVLEETAQQIAACMHDAYDVRRRAAVGYATTDWIVPGALTGVNAQPSTISVLRVEDSDGTPIAIVVTAPLMPDNVGTDELLTLSSDFPGYLCDAIDNTLGAGGGGLFFNGASGDYVREDMPKETSWKAIETLGNAVGTLVLELSETIECVDRPLAVRSSTATVPRSLGDTWLPNEFSLAEFTLGSLTMTFVPFGISEKILERSGALEGAPIHHEIVGFANGFNGHVVSESAYAADTQAARLHYFGPRMAQKLAAEIQSLTEDKNNSITPDTDTDTDTDHRLTVTESDGFYLLDTANQPASSRGAALAGLIKSSYEQRIHKPSAAGELLPSSHTLAHVPWFVDASPVSLLHMAFEVRPAWARLDAAQQRQLSGYADGAGLPLEAMWLLQHEEALLGYAGNTPDVPTDDHSLMFAVHGDKAGAERLLAGIRIPWNHLEPPMIHRGVSESGLPFASLTPAYALGAIAGMNGAGIVVCAVPNSERGRPRIALPPFSMQLERALGVANSADSLLENLAANASMDGYDLFVADTAAEKAVIVRGAMEPESPSLTRGLTADRLIDTASTSSDRDDPRRSLVDFATSASGRIVSADELVSFIADLEPPQPQDAAVEKFVCIIFEPKAKRMRVRIEGDDAASDEFVTLTLEADAS